MRSAALDLLAPVQTSLTGLFRTSANLLDSLQELQALERENRRLRRLVGQLRRENVELRQAALERQRLLRELEYQRANPDWEFIPARIIAWDPNSLVRSITIDKGRDDGIQEGMVVVSPGGLVGKVMALSRDWARVLLITDPRSSVNAVVQRADARPKGVLQGDPRGWMTLKYLPADSRVQKGDVVVTSGLGGGFPPGLFVGWVQEVTYNDTQMFQEAVVKSAVNLSEVERVMVIGNFIPTRLDQ
jgi:rod shape-determining protein MreC